MSDVNFIPEMADAVCEALRAAQAAGEFAIPFAGPERTYEPEFKIEESERQGLVVAVMALETEAGVLVRNTDQEEIGIQVGLWKRIDNRNTETIDPLLLFLRKVWKVLRTNLPLESGGTGSFLRRSCKPLYDPGQLKQNQFLSVTTFTYQHQHRP